MSRLIVNAKNIALVRGHRLLFKSLDFSLEEGQAIYLQGRNGSGKTSLFKLLTGSLSPTSGQLNVFEKTFREFEPIDYQNILYLGHKTAIKPSLTAVENLAFNVELFDQLKIDKAQLKYALSSVGLWEFRSQTASQLSAGQKRRISLARLWIALYKEKSQKRLWLLDEPLTALDSDFINVFQHHVGRQLALGGSVIFTSHQPLQLVGKVCEIDLGDFQ